MILFFRKHYLEEKSMKKFFKKAMIYQEAIVIYFA